MLKDALSEAVKEALADKIPLLVVLALAVIGVSFLAGRYFK